MRTRIVLSVAAILLLGVASAAAESPSDGEVAEASQPSDASDPREPDSPEPATPTTVTADLQAPLPAWLTASSSDEDGVESDGTCTVTENCDELPDISCSGTVCSAVSRDCGIEECRRGSVTCNGQTTYCSKICPPNCTFFECRQPCLGPGCTADCTDLCRCECEPICY